MMPHGFIKYNAFQFTASFKVTLSITYNNHNNNNNNNYYYHYNIQ